MKLGLGLLLALSTAPAWALECACEVYAFPPLTASHRIPPHLVGDVDAGVQEDNQLDPTLCRTRCQELSRNEYDATMLKERIAPWVDQLAADGTVGRNCTGPTTFKVPVRVRARLGAATLGIAREDMVFLHRQIACR